MPEVSQSTMDVFEHAPADSVLPFRSRAVASSPSASSPSASSPYDRQVSAALTAVAERAPAAAGTLFDLVSPPVFALALAITRDRSVAEDATVDTFAELWVTSNLRPEGAATSWVLEVACRCARALTHAARGSGPRATRLRLVSSL